ncbi:MAG TPA: YkgJ family cysteine cluster protein [Marinilabiliaceae bacterium]|nr:YkgJ family cysteine cluster protein [Marinilabiliaceae bacterium]
MECREKCGACCIAISISSPIPGMPNGKPAGMPCIHLTDNYQCLLFGSDERPQVCRGFKPEKIFCGNTQAEAIEILSNLEQGMIEGYR